MTRKTKLGVLIAMIVLVIIMGEGCATTEFLADDGLPCVREGMGNWVSEINGQKVCMVAYVVIHEQG